MATTISEKFDPIQLRPTVMKVDLGALVENYRLIAAHVRPAAVMPIVKSNAYGHGLLPCARALEAAGAPALGVALLEEGIALRQGGITTRVVVLGGVFTDQLGYFLDFNLEILASSVFKLKSIDEAARAAGKRARVHLEIDTGMERIGVHYYTAETLFEAALGCKHCEIAGVSTHFAAQEREDLSLTKIQLERFEECLRFFEKRALPIPPRHASASGAIIQFPTANLDLVRPGLMIYGVAPAPHLKGMLPLKPVLSLVSKVVFFKVVKAGTGVSYDHTWVAPRDTRVVTVPIGYGDGYLRGLSNAGEVLIRGKRYPIVGTVCMDQLMVDIGPEGAAYNGDEVVLIGRQGGEEIGLGELVKEISGNPREFLVSTSLRVPRVYG